MSPAGPPLTAYVALRLPIRGFSVRVAVKGKVGAVAAEEGEEDAGNVGLGVVARELDGDGEEPEGSAAKRKPADRPKLLFKRP